MTTPRDDRQIRVFLSSTFADMHGERNYLIKKIFPSIRKACEKRNVDFDVLDLRWGITEDEAKTGRVIEICMDEIERTRPYFIGILGGRYGWVPDEKEFAFNSRLLAKYPWLKDSVRQGKSITEMEMQFGALNNLDNVNAFFFLKNEKTVPAKFREDVGTEDAVKLVALRDKIKTESDKGRCTADTFSSLEQLGKVVRQRLMTMIDEKYPIDTGTSIYDRALARQKAVMARLRRRYVDHDHRVSNFDSYFFENSESRVKMVVGSPGSGKSALLANWRKDDVLETWVDIWTDDRGLTSPIKTPVIRTAVGGEIDSVEMLKRVFIYQLMQIYKDLRFDHIDNMDLFTYDTDINKIFKENGFAEKVVWVIDGLDHLGIKNTAENAWIFKLPDNIVVVTSMSEELYDILNQWLRGKDLIHRPSSLLDSEIIAITNSYLANVAKSLTSKQETHLLSNDLLSHPATLETMLDVLIQFGEFERFDVFLDTLVGVNDRAEFMECMLGIIEKDFDGRLLRRVLSILYMASEGLTEAAMVEALGLKPVEWAALLSAIQPLTRLSDSKLYLASDEIKNIVEHKYMDSTEDRDNATKDTIRALQIERRQLIKKNRANLSWGKKLFSAACTVICPPIKQFIVPEHINKMIMDNKKGLIDLYIETRQYRAARKLFTEYKGLDIIGYNGTNNADFNRAIAVLSEHGLHYRQLLSLRMSLIATYYLKDPQPAFILPIRLLSLRPNRLSERMLKWRIKLFPARRKTKDMLLQTLRALAHQESIEFDDNFEETWSAKNPPSLIMMTRFRGNIECMYSEKRIEHILQCAERYLQEDNDSAVAIIIKCIAGICEVRLGRIDEAQQRIDSIVVDDAVSLSTVIQLQLDIAVAKNSYESMTSTLETLRKIAETDRSMYPDYIINRIVASCMWEDEDTVDADIEKFLSFIAGLRIEQREGMLRSAADMLYVKDCTDASNRLMHTLAAQAQTPVTKASAWEALAEHMTQYSMGDMTRAEAYENAAKIYAEIGWTSNATKAYGSAAVQLYRNNDLDNMRRVLVLYEESARKSGNNFALSQAANLYALMEWKHMNQDCDTEKHFQIILRRFEEAMSYKQEIDYVIEHNILNLFYEVNQMKLGTGIERIPEVLERFEPHLQQIFDASPTRKHITANAFYMMHLVVGDFEGAQRIVDECACLKQTVENTYPDWARCAAGMFATDDSEIIATTDRLIGMLYGYLTDKKTVEYFQNHIVMAHNYGFLDRIMDRCMAKQLSDDLAAAQQAAIVSYAVMVLNKDTYAELIPAMEVQLYELMAEHGDRVVIPFIQIHLTLVKNADESQSQYLRAAKETIRVFSDSIWVWTLAKLAYTGDSWQDGKVLNKNHDFRGIREFFAEHMDIDLGGGANPLPDLLKRITEYTKDYLQSDLDLLVMEDLRDMIRDELEGGNEELKEWLRMTIKRYEERVYQSYEKWQRFIDLIEYLGLEPNEKLLTNMVLAGGNVLETKEYIELFESTLESLKSVNRNAAIMYLDALLEEALNGNVSMDKIKYYNDAIFVTKVPKSHERTRKIAAGTIAYIERDYRKAAELLTEFLIMNEDEDEYNDTETDENMTDENGEPTAYIAELDRIERLYLQALIVLSHLRNGEYSFAMQYAGNISYCPMNYSEEPECADKMIRAMVMYRQGLKKDADELRDKFMEDYEGTTESPMPFLLRTLDEFRDGI